MKNFTLKTLLMSVLLCVGVSAWGADETDTYTFTSKSWAATLGDETSDWTSESDGGFTSGQGVQITAKLSGANATSPTSYTNISKIIVTYCTNSKAGKGVIKVTVGSGTEQTFSVTAPSSGGTTLKTTEFNYADPESGKVKIEVTCSTNSIYIYSVAIKYNPSTSGKTSPEMSFSSSTATAILGEAFTAPTLTYKGDGAVTYKSSDTDVATVDSEGNVTINAAGTTTITATALETDTYDGDEVSYTLTVNKPAAGLAFSEENVAANLGKAFTEPTLSNPNSLVVSYTSSDTDVATVDSEGNVTLVGEGITTITATSAETSTYASGEASYTLTVTEQGKVIYNFAGTNDYNSGIMKGNNGSHYDYDASTWTNGDVTITVEGKYRWWSTDGTLRFYSNTPKSCFTVSALNGYYISKVVLTGGSNFATDKDTYDYASATWTGASTSVKFTYNASSGSINVKTIAVYTKPIYARSVTNGNYGTLCLPFGVDEEGISGATFYTISSKTMDGEDVKFISLEEVTSLTAGVGYIFQASADEIQLTPNGTTVEEPVTSGALVGTFTDVTAIPNGMYMLSSNKLYKTVEDYGKMNANRAYIDLSKVSEAGSGEAKGRILFADGYDEATGIKGVATDAADNAAIYNVAGQRVNAAYKGIVIKNGKKYLNK